VAVRVVAAPWVLRGPAGAAGSASDVEALPDGAVALDGEVVVAVGPRLVVESRHGPAERLDGVILPALVNAHLHLELSHLAGRVPGRAGLVAWIQALVTERARGGDVEEAMARGAAALAAAGVAAVADVSNTLASVPHLARERISGTVFHEVYGFTETRAGEALRRAAEDRLRLGPLPPGLEVHETPHAVYSTHPATAARLLRAGRASIHLAEDPDERRFCAEAAGPFADLVLRLGVEPGALRPWARSAVAAVAAHLGPLSLAVHAVDVDAEDRAALARSGATVVLCPRSNLGIGGRLPDLPALRRAAIPLAVGTDSLASVPSLSPLAELAALRAAYPEVPATALLPLAWNGAAVGAPAVGRLAPGTAPGVLLAPLGGERPADPAAWLLERHGTEERPFSWIARHRPEGGA
jgi:cytosine/adenosine deaminase-related metal-dependent hydrolase